MEESKKRIVVISLAIVVIIVVASLGLYLYNGDSGEASLEGISAMEGKDMADEVAISWNSSAILTQVENYNYHVQPYETIRLNSNGESIAWTYVYSDNNPTKSLTIWYYVIIYENGTYGSGEIQSHSYREITDWNIDSTEALEIASSYPPFQEWRDSSGKPYLHSMGLIAYPEETRWNVFFMDSDGWVLGEYSMWVDATTGEVIS